MRWYGHVVRFAIGGLVTAATGLVGKGAGPVVGGLFLAFPAIFPVGLVTLERLENRAAGPAARGHRARRAALAETVGATLGATGLTSFAVVAWKLPAHAPVAVALAVALFVWAAVALAAWYVRRHLLHRV